MSVTPWITSTGGVPLQFMLAALTTDAETAVVCHSVSPNLQLRYSMNCPPELTPATKTRFSSMQYSFFISASTSCQNVMFCSSTGACSQPSLSDFMYTVTAGSIAKPRHSPVVGPQPPLPQP